MMTIEQIFTAYWGLFLLAFVLGIISYVFYFFARKRKSKEKVSAVCNHKFEYGGSIVINKNGKDFPRQIQYCSKCKAAIHLPIKTLSEQAEE